MSCIALKVMSKTVMFKRPTECCHQIVIFQSHSSIYHQVNYHVHADDTQFIYVSFDPTTPDGLENALSKLQNCITDIQKLDVCK